MARCTGYRGVCHSREDYPSGDLPDSMFTESVLKNGEGMCKPCRKVAGATTCNHNQPFYWAIAGGREAYYALNKAMRKLCRISADYGGDIPPPSAREVVFENTKSRSDKVSKGSRDRDQKVVRWVQRFYDACIIPGCEYKHYHVAHIHALKHDADDLPENCIPLCPNHHADLDGGRVLLIWVNKKLLLWRGLDVSANLNLEGEHVVERKHVLLAMDALHPTEKAA